MSVGEPTIIGRYFQKSTLSSEILDNKIEKSINQELRKEDMGSCITFQNFQIKFFNQEEKLKKNQPQGGVHKLR